MEQGEADLILVGIVAKALCAPSTLKCCVERRGVVPPQFGPHCFANHLCPSHPPGDRAEPLLLSLSAPHFSPHSPHCPPLFAPHFPLCLQDPSEGMWIFGVLGGLEGSVFQLFSLLPAPLMAPPLLLFASFALSLFNGEIKVAVQKKNPKMR